MEKTIDGPRNMQATGMIVYQTSLAVGLVATWYKATVADSASNLSSISTGIGSKFARYKPYEQIGQCNSQAFDLFCEVLGAARLTKAAIYEDQIRNSMGDLSSCF